MLYIRGATKMGENGIDGLEKILTKAIDVLDDSKTEMFSIAESSRKEMKNIEEELQLLNKEINAVIDKTDKLEKANRRARIRLMEVSKDLHRYSEKDIKVAYKEAEDTSIEIAVLKEKEEQLKSRRFDLEGRLVNIKGTVKKAENLVSKVGVVRDYLYGELNDLSEHFDDLRQKQQVAFKVIEAQEEERKRVAREIHDGPAQSLANLVFRVEFVQKLLDKDLSKAKNELDSLKNLLRMSVQDVRKIIYDLRPMSLDDLGLIPTLKRYIDKYIDQTRIMIELKIRGEERRLPSTYEITIFRLIQEALNNIYRHSDAYLGKINIEYLKDNINLVIVDDGKGFNSKEIEGDKYGLIGMRERCELLNGKLDINTQINKGTRINIQIPIK